MALIERDTVGLCSGGSVSWAYCCARSFGVMSGLNSKFQAKESGCQREAAPASQFSATGVAATTLGDLWHEAATNCAMPIGCVAFSFPSLGRRAAAKNTLKPNNDFIVSAAVRLFKTGSYRGDYESCRRLG